MENGRQKLTDRLVELLERAYIEMRQCVPEEWSDTELTIPQLKTLLLLRQSSNRMGVIAEYLGTSLPSATSMVDRLVDKHLVARASDPNDRRVVTCQLTPKGQEEVERLWRIERITLAKFADHMNIEEIQTVIDAMEILCRASLSVREERTDSIASDRIADTAN